MRSFAQRLNMKKCMAPTKSIVILFNNVADSKASNDQLKTTGRAGEDTRHRNSLTVSIIEDSDG